MRKLLFLSLLTFLAAGCSHLTGPGEEHPSKPDGDYAWPNTDTSLTYRSGYDGHVITLTSTGRISDKDQNSGTTTTLTATNSGGTYTLSGLTSRDIFGIGTIQIAVAPSSVAIHSIGSMNSELYALSDTALYKYDPASNSLRWLEHAPAANLNLYEDHQSNNTRLFAAAKGGTDVWVTNGNSLNGPKWTQVFSNLPPITTILPDRDHDGDVVWIASGNQVYRYSQKHGPDKACTLSANVTVLDDGRIAYTDALAGLQNGSIAALREDSCIELPCVATEITGMGLGLVSTHSGLFDILGQPQPSNKPIRDDLENIFYSAHPLNGQDVIIAFTDGRLAEFDNGTIIPMGVPLAGTPVTQVASVGPMFSDYFALAGDQIWHSQGPTGWTTVGATAPVQPQPPTSSFVLLGQDTAWNADLVEDFGNGLTARATYHASVLAPASRVTLDSVQYSDVIIISYVPTGAVSASPGVTIIAAPDLPQFTIYYQRGLGPVRIERLIDGSTTVTRLTK